jgi:hypothetical protein
MGVIYELHRWDSLRRHDIHTKFHEDWFGHSGNIKVIASTIWEAAVLVLLMGAIYEVRYLDGLRWHDVRTEFHEDWLGHSGNIKVIT